MATVEQCETQSSGLSTLIFETFKPSQEEDKDSDEESFHLPLLDCDEDLENKDAIKSEICKESEDDILNKFETNVTPDLDPKIEDSILEEIDNILDKKPSESSIDEINQDSSSFKDTSDIAKANSPVPQSSGVADNQDEKINKTEVGNIDKNSDEMCNEEKKVENIVQHDEFIDDNKVGSTSNYDAKPNDDKIDIATEDTDSGEDKLDLTIKDMEVNGDLAVKGTEVDDDKINLGLSDVEMNEGRFDLNAKDEEMNQAKLDAEEVKESEIVHESESTTEDLITNNTDKDSSDLPDNKETFALTTEVSIANNTDEDLSELPDNNETLATEAVVEKVQESSELVKSNEETTKIDELDIDSKKADSEISKDSGITSNSFVEAMEVDNSDEFMTNEEQTEETNSISNEVPQKDENTCDDANQCVPVEGNDSINDTTEMESTVEPMETEKIDTEDITDSTGKPVEIEETDAEADTTLKNDTEPIICEKSTNDENKAESDNCENATSNAGPDRCENSNDSTKSQNLECDDLLDISIIRDADEDNASAIAENANEAQASEKSDNDDQDEGSDKAENELDESEIDQDDTLLANDKDDNMDFEEGNSNLCDQDNIISENTSDSDSKANSETRDSESNSSVLKQKNDINVDLSSESNTEEDKVAPNFEAKDITSDTVSTENQESFKENAPKTCKRSLSEADILDSSTKKIKLSEYSKSEDKITISKTNKIKTLVNFEKFMQNKKLENKLTRSDLEQFCLQKICEAIMHKTNVGELHQTIKKQEQIIENLRKDLQQLTKQTRDLDIVNKKLMTELKSQNNGSKPLVPLKITRSVGLQVKLNSGNEINNRRKIATPVTPRTPVTANTSARPRTVPPANSPVVRQVAASPRKNAPTAPLLSQALQTRQVTPATSNPPVKRPAVLRTKPIEPPKPANPGVIDLTDEDDKASKGVVKIINKTIPLTAQGKTINIVPAKTTANKTLTSNQNKTVAVGQAKTGGVGTKIGTPTRTVTTLPQGVRLTSTQVKNGSIAIPASVVTSNSGTTQFMYVVQPGSVVTSTAGTQKAVLLNFQPTNGVLTSTLNGSAVSVVPTKTTNTVQLKTVPAPRKHPAPLPSPPSIPANASLKPLLPKPHLSIRKTDTGIILQWRMPYNLDIYEAIASYQLFAYQETSAPPSTDMWRKVGDVKALALPMACTLTQFADKNKYYFAVRSVDVHKRIGAFSDPEEISL